MTRTGFENLLRRAFPRGLLSGDQTTRLKPMIDDLTPMLNAYLRSIGSGDNRPASDGQSDPKNHGPLTTDH